MNVRIENLLLVWDETITTLFLTIVNTAVSARTEEELRTAIVRIASETELYKYFAYGYGKHHLWVNQKNTEGRCMNGRLMIVEF